MCALIPVHTTMWFMVWDFSPSGQSTLIDLVFVSNLDSLSNCSVIPQLSNSDHVGLMVTLKHQHVASISMPRRRVWRYKHADFDKANELLCDMDLDKILNPYDIQTSWKRFKSAFLDVMEQCIPRSVLPTRNNRPWLTKEIIQLIRRRNHHFRKANRRVTEMITWSSGKSEIELWQSSELQKGDISLTYIPTTNGNSGK